jgi:hypothetical protein
MASFLRFSLASLLACYLVWACRTSGGANSGIQRASHDSGYDSAYNSGYDSAYNSGYDSAYEESFESPYNSRYGSNNSSEGEVNCGYNESGRRVPDTFTYNDVSSATLAMVASHSINCRASANPTAQVKASFRKLTNNRSTKLALNQVFKRDERGVCWLEIQASRCWIAARPSMIILEQ